MSTASEKLYPALTGAWLVVYSATLGSFNLGAFGNLIAVVIGFVLVGLPTLVLVGDVDLTSSRPHRNPDYHWLEDVRKSLKRGVWWLVGLMTMILFVELLRVMRGAT